MSNDLMEPNLFYRDAANAIRDRVIYSKLFSPYSWRELSNAEIAAFTFHGPTQSILAHFTRASIGARRSLALTACERKEWPRNRCMNP